jgi:tetratricopeptide (TPR) repeat protein
MLAILYEAQGEMDKA